MAQSKTYLVVGGSSGIGFDAAKLLADHGNRVILVSSNVEKLSFALQQLNGENHLMIPCDLSQPENVGEVFTQLEQKNIVLDGMVYCAGVAPLCLLKENTSSLMKQVFSINVLSFIEMAKFFYKESVSCTGSRIVAVSSITAHGAGYRQILYGSSKAALISAVKLMSKELLNRDIRVNCVSPGVVETPMLDRLRKESQNLDEKIKASQPLGILPSAEVAKVIRYMLEEGSDFCTGTEFALDAGAYLK